MVFSYKAKVLSVAFFPSRQNHYMNSGFVAGCVQIANRVHLLNFADALVQPGKKYLTGEPQYLWALLEAARNSGAEIIMVTSRDISTADMSVPASPKDFIPRQRIDEGLIERVEVFGHIFVRT